MKTYKLTLLTLVSFFLFFSCTEKLTFKEGPLLSLRTKKARIIRVWKIEKYIDPSGIVTPENKSPIFSFEKDGKGRISNTLLEQNNSIEFHWELTHKKKFLKLTTFGDFTEQEIIRLTVHEMWVKDSEGDQTHFKAQVIN